MLESNDKKPESCANCKYLRELPADPNNIGAPRQLICKNSPPSPVLVPIRMPNGQLGTQLTAAYPPVSDDGWCGQWSEG